MSVLNADAAAEPKGPRRDPLQTSASCAVQDSGVQDGRNRSACTVSLLYPREAAGYVRVAAVLTDGMLDMAESRLD